MAELANAIRAKYTQNKQALILIESDGKNADGETIVTKYDRHSWRRIMLEPYRIQHQNDWAHEAIVLLNSMSQRDLALHVNDRGGCFEARRTSMSSFNIDSGLPDTPP